MSDERLAKEVRVFLEAHADGWSHEDWLGFIHHLNHSGFDTTNEDGIGLALERARLDRTLMKLKIRGLGPKRIEAIGDRFGTLWNLRHAPSEAIDDVGGLPTAIASLLRDKLG